MNFDDDTELDEPVERDESDDDDDGKMTWNEYKYVPDLERDIKRMRSVIRAMNEAHGFTLWLTVSFDANLQGYQSMQNFDGQTEEEQIAAFELGVPETTLSAKFVLSEEAIYPDIPLREMLARCVAFTIRHLAYDARVAAWCHDWGKCSICEPNLNADGSSNLDRRFSAFGFLGFTHDFGVSTDYIEIQSPIHCSQLVREIRLPDTAEISLFAAAHATEAPPIYTAARFQAKSGTSAIWL